MVSLSISLLNSRPHFTKAYKISLPALQFRMVKFYQVQLKLRQTHQQHLDIVKELFKSKIMSETIKVKTNVIPNLIRITAHFLVVTIEVTNEAKKPYFRGYDHWHGKFKRYFNRAGHKY